jgi:uncharacterized protein YdcH (DUF465 family)
MTFEETMHTIVSHLEALQAEYDRLLEESNKNNRDFRSICYSLDKHFPNWRDKINNQQPVLAEYDRLLEINNQLRVENVELEKRIEELE